MAMIRRQHPDAQTVIAFASEEAHDSIRGWLRHAAETLGVRLFVVEIPNDLRARIRAAQEGQVMVNLSVAEVAEDVNVIEVAEPDAPVGEG